MKISFRATRIPVPLGAVRQESSQNLALRWPSLGGARDTISIRKSKIIAGSTTADFRKIEGDKESAEHPDLDMVEVYGPDDRYRPKPDRDNNERIEDVRK